LKSVENGVGKLGNGLGKFGERGWKAGKWAWKAGERDWRAIRDRLRRPYYLSRVDHVRKIRDRMQRTDIGKYSFINRTIKNWRSVRNFTL